jgi:lysophospholipase L1-like esterase
MIVILIFLAVLVGVLWVWLRLEPMLGIPHLAELSRLHSSLAADEDKLIVCLGDSLTHGNASFDYVGELARRLEPWGYTVVNAGLNSDLAYNVVERLDPVLAIDPAYVLLLVGTNDVRGIESERAAQRYVKRQSLPQSPDEAFFESNYRRILERLRDESRARVITMTIPVLGERGDEPINAVLGKANAFVQQISADFGHRCLPLNAELKRHLPTDSDLQRPVYDANSSERLVLRAVLQHHLLGWSWDRIADANGMLLLTDMIHLSEQGGRLLVDLVEAEIRPMSRTLGNG